MRDSGRSHIPDDSNGRRQRGGILATNRPRGLTTTKKLVSQFLISKHPQGGCTRPTERPTRVHSKYLRIIRGPGYLFNITAHPMGFLSFTLPQPSDEWHCHLVLTSPIQLITWSFSKRSPDIKELNTSSYTSSKFYYYTLRKRALQIIPSKGNWTLQSHLYRSWCV